MIKYIFHFVHARLISSKTKSWYVSCVGVRAIVANGRLELQCMKHVMYMPLAMQLKMERHGTNSSNDPKLPKKLSSKLLR